MQNRVVTYSDISIHLQSIKLRACMGISRDMFSQSDDFDNTKAIKLYALSFEYSIKYMNDSSSFDYMI